MLLKVVTAFLVLMAVIALFGRLRFPGGTPRIGRAEKCSRCGKPRIGPGPCECRNLPRA